MASTVDFEEYVDAITTLFQANLNTAIDAINTEKNDGTSIAHIDSGAYFFHSLDEGTANYNPFILFEIQDATTVGDLGHTQTSLEIFIGVVLADRGTDLKIVRKLLRYQRAMRQVVETNFDKISGGAKMLVQSQNPIELTLSNAGYACKAIGIVVKLDLG